MTPLLGDLSTSLSCVCRGASRSARYSLVSAALGLRGKRMLPTFAAPDCTLSQKPGEEDAQDRALVRQYLDGDGQAAGSLVERYERRLFNVALRMLGNVQDAEDVTQTTFCNAFLSMQSYDPQYRFFSWIYRMAVNESLNQLKRRRPMVTLEERSSIPQRGVAADDA